MIHRLPVTTVLKLQFQAAARRGTRRRAGLQSINNSLGTRRRRRAVALLLRGLLCMRWRVVK